MSDVRCQMSDAKCDTPNDLSRRLQFCVWFSSAVVLQCCGVAVFCIVLLCCSGYML